MSIPYWDNKEHGLYLYGGDCLTVLKRFKDNSVDSVVTDPPYGLAFMGKKWDYDVPSVQVWQEVLRVLKPGGYLLAFAGTRTQHRMCCNIEDAGFEIRDMMCWMYGSGFPKSLDVSKAITKTTKAKEVRTIKKWLNEQAIICGKSKTQINKECGFLSTNYFRTEEGKDAAGRDTWHLLLPKPDKWYKMKEVIGFSDKYDSYIDKLHKVESEKGAALKSNPEIYGTYSGVELDYTLTDLAKQWDGWGTALKPALEPITLARKPLSEKTIAANVLEHGTGGLNIDGCRVGSESTVRPTGDHSFGKDSGWNEHNLKNIQGGPQSGRWPANVVLDEEAGAILDQQSGQLQSGKPGVRKKKHQTTSMAGLLNRTGKVEKGIGDKGGASRFFYCAKASKKERTINKQVECKHPTVKPIKLMRYLIRLVTPPNGIALDPFVGSGTTVLAAYEEGFRCIGIEREAESFKTAVSRIEATIEEK